MSVFDNDIAVLERELLGPSSPIQFLTPMVSTALAAMHCVSPQRPVPQFGPGARSYATTIGLMDSLHGRKPTTRPAGSTYSGIVQLNDAHAVEGCTGAIADFVYGRLASHEPLAREIVRLIGELHDNVASHARGVGFSAAQVYSSNIFFAIADAGCGMPRNVRGFLRKAIGDVEAVAWCLERGNTTGGIEDPMAQTLPEDAMHNPFPRTVPVRRSANNHLGEGLWLLRELARVTRGAIMVWSQEGRVVEETARPRIEASVPRWNGTLIAVQLPLAANAVLDQDHPEDAELEALAEELGL